MAEYNLKYPPPPKPSYEDPSCPFFMDELTGFEMLSYEVGFQNGLRKNINDRGSWEESPTYPTRSIPGIHLQTIPFGAGDNG